MVNITGTGRRVPCISGVWWVQRAKLLQNSQSAKCKLRAVPPDLWACLVLFFSCLLSGVDFAVVSSSCWLGDLCTEGCSQTQLVLPLPSMHTVKQKVRANAYSTYEPQFTVYAWYIHCFFCLGMAAVSVWELPVPLRLPWDSPWSIFVWGRAVSWSRCSLGSAGTVAVPAPTSCIYNTYHACQW